MKRHPECPSGCLIDTLDQHFIEPVPVAISIDSAMPPSGKAAFCVLFGIQFYKLGIVGCHICKE